MAVLSCLLRGRIPFPLPRCAAFRAGPSRGTAVTIALLSLLALAVLQSATFAIARRIRRYNIVDVVWSLGFVLVALVAAIVGDGALDRRMLLLGLVTVWGLWLITASGWPGVRTVFAPLLMSYVLIQGPGARLLERNLGQRPGYREYQQRTAYFLPRTPHRARSH
ncbi:DUF1295 domain-containing protein [Nocardia sp.]|uniref:DUF1295 domain-containing protein n=1 Tax=Nocardia sp. TaxID=1821 RepID=UPI0026210DEA|nr:DUF1295 domain-containing protein [Nocardia sp.]